MKRIVPCFVVVIAIGLLTSSAAADVSKKVNKTFRGKMLISERALPIAVGDDATTVKKYKAMDLKEVKHDMVDGVATWTWHYTAFLTKAPRNGALAIEFYTTNKKKLFVADKRLTGVSPKLTILRGMLIISEDDNVNRGRTYDVKVNTQIGKREVTLAKTRLSLK